MFMEYLFTNMAAFFLGTPYFILAAVVTQQSTKGIILISSFPVIISLMGFFGLWVIRG